MATRHRGRDWTDLSALIVRPLRQARCQTSRTSNQSLRRGASRVLCPTPRHLAPACSFPRQRQKGTPTAHRAYRDRNHRKKGPSMRISSLVLALLLVTGAPGTLAAQPELKTEEQKTPSGAVVTTLKPGTGASPTATDKVKVHYHGTLTDGTVFDSSVQRGEPITFPLSGVIKCWTEGVQQMKVGGKSRLVCPADTAYGDRGAPPKIKPGATLVFEVELLEIVK